jgi:hypothetical protein
MRVGVRVKWMEREIIGARLLGDTVGWKNSRHPSVCIHSLFSVKKEFPLRNVGEKGQLNLSTTLPKTIIDQAEKAKGLQYIDIDETDLTATQASGSSMAWVKLGSALSRLQEIFGNQDGRSTTRIIINELGSADWDEPSAQVRCCTSSFTNSHADITGITQVPTCS